MNAFAGVRASPPIVSPDGVSSSDRALYLRNLSESGYNAKNNFDKFGNVAAQ
jgi:hypothetical protein